MIAIGSDLLLVSVGNTRTRLASVRAGQLEPSRVVDNAAAAEAVKETLARGESEDRRCDALVVASVSSSVSTRIESACRDQGGPRVLRFGPDLPIPIVDALSDRSTVGQDRLFNALGAFSRTRQACIVIDAGTAITVDFVDGQGTFQGGAIAPGLAMMLEALHERTAALPKVDPGRLGAARDAPFGKDTPEAMVVGVLGAARGLAHGLIDRYAEFYEAYPMVVATGGDAPLLFEDDPLIERIVPDLALVGMLAAVERLIESEAGDDDD